MLSIPSGATYSTVDRQHPHSSGIRLVLTCYSTCHVCLRGRRIQRGPSGSLESRFQCSVPSAESLGTFPSDAPLLVSRETCSRGLCWHHGSADVTLQPLLPGMVSPVHLLSVPGMPDTTVRNPVASRMSHHRTTMLRAGLDAVLRAPTDAVQSMGDPSNLHCWRDNRYLPLGEGAETASPTSNQLCAHGHHARRRPRTENHPPPTPSWLYGKPAVLGLSP